MPVRENPLGVVVELASRRQEVEPTLTDAERRELREHLAYMRQLRPFLEAIKHRCPTARNIASELDED